MRQFCVIWFLIPTALYGQVTETGRVHFRTVIPEVAMIGISPDQSTISLKIAPPREGGEPLDISEARDDTKWLNYSTSLRAGAPNRNLQVQIVSGEVPKGVDLMLEISEAEPWGAVGKTGKPEGKVILTQSPKVVLKGIGGAVTGRGVGKGHRLAFFLEADRYSQINFGKSTVTIVFTLTDN